MNPEIRNAKNLYWWLWLSPALMCFSIPIVAGFTSIVQGALPRNANLTPVNVLLALAIGMPHLILLFPSFLAKSEFVRWHARQALILAGIQTVSIALIVITFFAIPVFGAVWLIGNIWGYWEAKHGDCALMRWAGRGAGLPLPLMIENAAQPVSSNDRSDSLVQIIRFSRNETERQEALAKLTRRGMVEEM